MTYTRESDTAVTALGGSGELFQMVVDKLATRGLDHPPAVGGGVVRRALAEGDTLGHCEAIGSAVSMNLASTPL